VEQLRQSCAPTHHAGENGACCLFDFGNDHEDCLRVRRMCVFSQLERGVQSGAAVQLSRCCFKQSATGSAADQVLCSESLFQDPKMKCDHAAAIIHGARHRHRGLCRPRTAMVGQSKVECIAVVIDVT